MQYIVCLVIYILLCFDTIHMCDSQTHGQHAVACCSYNDGDGHLVNVQRNKACSSSMHCGTECVNNVNAGIVGVETLYSVSNCVSNCALCSSSRKALFEITVCHVRLASDHLSN